MEETNVGVLVKSEKISQKKKIRLVWGIAVLLVIVTIVSFIIDYSGYKKGLRMTTSPGCAARAACRTASAKSAASIIAGFSPAARSTAARIFGAVAPVSTSVLTCAQTGPARAV